MKDWFKLFLLYLPFMVGVTLLTHKGNKDKEEINTQLRQLKQENEELKDSLEKIKKVVKLEKVTLNSIKKVESNNNPKLIGDEGRAYGCLQIHKICVDEVNKRYKKHYTHEDMFSEKKSIEVFWFTMRYLSEDYYKKHKHYPKWDYLIEAWNGGYVRNEKTKAYLKKVNSLINS